MHSLCVLYDSHNKDCYFHTQTVYVFYDSHNNDVYFPTQNERTREKYFNVQWGIGFKYLFYETRASKIK
jgi:hypothetical protein